MFLPPHSGRLVARETESKDKQSNSGGKNNIFIIVSTSPLPVQGVHPRYEVVHGSLLTRSLPLLSVQHVLCSSWLLFS